MRLTALTWNLFHGRDFPPDPSLFTWRSRLLRVSERNESHLQVNRDLEPEFSELLAGAAWDVALLQEVPPRWAGSLARHCEAAGHRSLTSRNSLPRLRALAARLNPDLIASNEGGSNLTLVRTRSAAIVERRELELRPARRPERRALAFTRLALTGGGGELCIGNLHASAGRENRHRAEEEAGLAATRCLEWAAGAPLVLGGDFNLRPRESTLFDELAKRHGIEGAGDPDAIDHLLAHDLRRVAGPRAWAPDEREVRAGKLALRLSDHAPVEATFVVQPDARFGAGAAQTQTRRS